MKFNKGFSAIYILVFLTLVAFAGTIFYLQKEHGGKGEIPFALNTDAIKNALNSPAPNDNQPKVDAGPDIAINTPNSSVVLKGIATTKDGGALSYMWFKLSGGKAKIVTPESNSTLVTGLQKGQYLFRLIASDSKGVKSADDLFVTVGGTGPTAAIASTSSGTKSGTKTSVVTTTTTTTAPSGPTKATVATHNTQSDCWLILSGKVYNVTTFIASHPGGKSVIVSRCGTDATAAFNGGVYNHSTYARSLLPSYYVGVLSSGTTTTTTDTNPTVVVNIPPFASAGPDQYITLPSSSVSLSGSGNDSDGNIVSYVWTKISGSGAYINSPSSPVTDITGLTQGSYTFRLTVTDNKGATATDDVSITVNAALPPPPASGYTTAQVATHSNASDCYLIISNKVYNVTAFISSHPGGQSVIVSRCGTDATVAFNGGVYNHSSYARSLLPTYYIGDLSTNTPPPNIPPSVNAGLDQTITLPTSTVTLSGTATDSDGSIASQSWTKVSGGAATITSPSSLSTTITGLVQGSYTFRLTATDNIGATGSATIIVTVAAAPVNSSPTADAGTAQTISLPTSTVTLTGTGYDTDGTIASYAWTKVSGTGGTITTPSAATTTVTGLSQGSYSYRLTVTDNQGATGSATVAITVNAAPANIPPTADAGAPQSITLPTNSVTLTGAGSDSDGTIASYLWAKISGGVASIVSPSSASTSVTGLVVGLYSFQLTVTDNQGATGTSTVAVTVNATAPTNNPPTANAGTPQTITLPTSTVTLTGSGTDTDGTIASYAWTKTAGSGTITSPALASTTVTGLTAGTSTFRLTVTDDQGATGSATVTITVNAAPVNNPPTANAGTPQTITLPTSTVTLTGSGTDTDGTIASYAWTNVSGPVTPTIATPSTASTNVTGLSTAGSYVFRLTVTDNQGATGSATVTITVNAAAPTGYTAAQVATHNVQANCWLIISAKVYNVTSFINAHPGGKSVIVSRCGTDATTAFNGGVWNHSAYARSLLPTYYVGDLIP